MVKKIFFRKKKNEIPKRSVGRRIWRFVWKSCVWFFVITIAWVVLYKWANPPVTIIQMAEKCNCPAGSSWRKGDWASLDEISLNMKLAVVASEDNNFMKHGGVDWGAVEKAEKYNATVGKNKGKQRGASTITQQTAKNVFLWKGTSQWSKWVRKAFELYFTYLIEWIWGKERILEVYLNVIEMGPCKFGITAAAEDYFHTSPANLSKEQAALIAGCLPNPKKYSVSKPGSYMKKRQSQIVRLMRLIGDGYFERYGRNMEEKQRKREEEETEKRIKEIKPEDLPEKIEEDTQETTPDEEPFPQPEIQEYETNSDTTGA